MFPVNKTTNEQEYNLNMEKDISVPKKKPDEQDGEKPPDKTELKF